MEDIVLALVNLDGIPIKKMNTTLELKYVHAEGTHSSIVNHWISPPMASSMQDAMKTASSHISFSL